VLIVSGAGMIGLTVSIGIQSILVRIALALTSVEWSSDEEVIMELEERKTWLLIQFIGAFGATIFLTRRVASMLQSIEDLDAADGLNAKGIARVYELLRKYAYTLEDFSDQMVYSDSMLEEARALRKRQRHRSQVQRKQWKMMLLKFRALGFTLCLGVTWEHAFSTLFIMSQNEAAVKMTVLAIALACLAIFDLLQRRLISEEDYEFVNDLLEVRSSEISRFQAARSGRVPPVQD